MGIHSLSPIRLALAFSATPYFLLGVVGTTLGENLWADRVIVLSSMFLGFIVGGSLSFRIKLLEMHQKIKRITIDEDEVRGWHASLEENLNRRLPFKAGLALGVLLILPHYLLYGRHFSQDYGLLLYVLNILVLWLPSVTFLLYVVWIVILEYFWIYGLNPREHPVRLGRPPPPMLQGLLSVQEFKQPTIRVGRMRSIGESGLQPIASLALFGSILMGIGGAIAMPVILMGVESKLAAFLIVGAIVASVIATFIYPLRKIQGTLTWHKKAKLERINAVLEEKIAELERIMLDLREGKPKTTDLEEIRRLTLYIDALNVLDQTHSKSKTLPVDLAMISKLLASIMAPVISFILKTGLLKP
jgi:hypothetical protein